MAAPSMPTPGYATEVLRQLRLRNAIEVHAFSGITEEYMACLERAQVMQVRVGQLEKEAAELQEENRDLATACAAAKESEARGEEVLALGEKVRDLNLELGSTYKEKSKLAEDLLQMTSQLQIVRQNNEMQSKEMNDDKERIEKLQQQVKDLAASLEKEKAARAVAAEECEARQAAKEEAVKAMEALKAENSTLIDTVVAMKVEQAELLNKAVQEHESAVKAAQTVKAAAAQDALARQESQGTGLGAGEGIVRMGLSLMRGGSNRQARVSSDGHDAAGAGPSWSSVDPPGAEAVCPTRVLASMEAHAGGCYSVRFSRSGFRLATAGGDKTVRLWDPDTGSSLNRLEGTLGTVLDVEWTCDDQCVLGAGSDKALRLWDAGTGRVRHTLTGHSDKVTTVSCSPADPGKAVSGSTDRTIKIWNLQKGFVDRTIVCHSSINAVTTTLDGQIVISGHFDGALRFWDLRSGKAINEVTGVHAQQITSVSVCNRSNCILTSSKDDTIALVDIASHEIGTILRGPGHLASRACLSPDDKFAACGLSEGGICVWNISSGAVETTLHAAKGHRPGSQILATAWSPAGAHVASCDRQGMAIVWHGDEAVSSSTTARW